MQASSPVPVLCPFQLGIAIPINPLNLLSLLADQSIDLKGLCIFCLDKADFSSSFELQKLTQNLSHIWPYFRPNWNDNLIPGYTFVVGKAADGSGDVYSNIPPMCIFCKNRISKMVSNHAEIIELRKKIEALEKDIERCTNIIKKRMEEDESLTVDVNCYKMRYETLLKKLMSGTTSAKILSNTVDFLNQLRGYALNGPHEDMPEEIVIKADPPDISPEEDVAIDGDVHGDDEEEVEVDRSLLGSNKFQVSIVQKTVPVSSSKLRSSRKSPLPRYSSFLNQAPQGKKRDGSGRECEVCDEPVEEGKMYRHLRSHVGDMAYKCPNVICNTAYLTRWSYKFMRHCQTNKNCLIIATATNALRKVCKACSKEFTSLQTFGNHMKSHETETKNFKCPLQPCNEQFTLKESLEYHLHSTPHNSNILDSEIIQAAQELQKCAKPSCKGLLFKPDKMEVHLRKKHEVKNVINCKYCSFVFPDMEELVLHVGDHIEKDYASVTCDICCNDETLFFKVSTLREHYFTKHGIGKILICERKSCKFACFTRQQLARHLETCKKNALSPPLQNILPYACTVCTDPPMAFQRASGLKRHQVKIHGGELTDKSDSEQNTSQFHCRFCSKTFVHVVSLARHMRNTHARNLIGIYSCRYCNEKLPSQLMLRKHIVTVHKPLSNSKNPKSATPRNPESSEDNQFDYGIKPDIPTITII